MGLDIWKITWPGGVDSFGPRFLLDVCHLICPLHFNFHASLSLVDIWHGILQHSPSCVHLHGHVLVLGVLYPIPYGSLCLGISFTGRYTRILYSSRICWVQGESQLKGGKELKRDHNLSIHGLQMELNVLQPLAEFEHQTEENSEAFSQLRDEERVRGLVLDVSRLAQRWLSHSIP
jgi:hypothetical protein